MAIFSRRECSITALLSVRCEQSQHQNATTHNRPHFPAVLAERRPELSRSVNESALCVVGGCVAKRRRT